MERATPSAQPTGDRLFRDGLGERRLVRDASGAVRELLCIRAELADVPAFEFALRERVARLTGFRHPYFAPVRSVERLGEAAYPLGLLSERFNGIRLPQLFAHATRRSVRLDIDATVFLLRQLLPAIVTFHESHRDVSLGALSPERVVFTANGRLMITEYALGAALEQLRYPRVQYWRDLRVALPDGATRFDQRADVVQLGLLALSLILGRPLRDDEFPERIGDLVAATWAAVPAGGLEPVPPPVREWLVRALQMDRRHPFTTAADALTGLTQAADATDYPGKASSIEAFLAAFTAGQPAVAERGIEADEAARVEASAPDIGAGLAVSASPPGASVFKAPTPRPISVPPPSGTVASAVPSEPALATEPSSVVLTPGHPSGEDGEPSTPLEEAFVDDFLPESELAIHTGPRGQREPMAAADAAVTPAAMPEPAAVPGPVTTSLVSILPEASTPTLAAFQDAVTPAPVVPPPPLAIVPTASPASGPAVRTSTVVPAAFVAVESPADFDLQAPLPPVDATQPVAAAHGPATAADPNKPGLQALPREWQVAALILAFLSAAVALIVGQRMLVPGTGLPTGRLVITTNPRGATASLDGQPLGTTPLTVTVPAGQHTLVLQGHGEPRTVDLNMAPGGSIEQYFELPPAPDTAALQTGWLTLRAPVELEVLEGGRVIGTSAAGRLSLPAGVHTLTFRNDAFGFSTTHLVNVATGKSTTLGVEVPKGTIVVHAVPDADVWIDGRRIGQTPIENLPVTIGTHDLILRHPDLGDHRESLTVSLRTPARVSVDLRKP